MIIPGATADNDAIATVAERRHSVPSQTDIITEQRIVARCHAIEHDAVPPVGGDDIPLARVGSTDQIMPGGNDNSIRAIAQTCRAGPVRPNEISLHDVAAQATQADSHGKSIQNQPSNRSVASGDYQPVPPSRRA